LRRTYTESYRKFGEFSIAKNGEFSIKIDKWRNYHFDCGNNGKDNFPSSSLPVEIKLTGSKEDGKRESALVEWRGIRLIPYGLGAMELGGNFGLGMLFGGLLGGAAGLGMSFIPGVDASTSLLEAIKWEAAKGGIIGLATGMSYGFGGGAGSPEEILGVRFGFMVGPGMITIASSMGTAVNFKGKTAEGGIFPSALLGAGFFGYFFFVAGDKEKVTI